MDTNLSQHTGSLTSKVFHTHTDIRIDSIEDVTQPPEQSEAAGAQLQPSSVSPTEDADKKKAALMRMWWDEAMARHMVLSEGYSHVAVLIIKWADYLDDLDTKDEVRTKLQIEANDH